LPLPSRASHADGGRTQARVGRHFSCTTAFIADYQRLLRECSHKPRDAAVIEVFLQTGIRLSELAKLQLTDVEIPKRITPDPDNMGSIRVKRKGGKTEYIPLNHKVCKAIAAYLLVRPEVGETALFSLSSSVH
jgi:site-specific recombinase XerD